ncbi:MAG TPA: HEAT repeat domain-containing protein, partial [Pyrinomonadaceae bacterium]
SRAKLLALTACLLLPVSSANVVSQNRGSKLQNPTSGDPVPKILLLRILRAEDERRWDHELRDLFSARNAAVRSRAALAAGRVGNEEAVGDLITLLQRDDEPYVRAMAAFALGEIEAPGSAKALTVALKDANDPLLRARAVEALGKIAAALPKEQEALGRELGGAILETLASEARRGPAADRLTVLLGLTAALRAKQANAGPTVAEFLQSSDPRVRADAANTLARLRLKDGNDQLRKLLMSDADPIVRANAARVLGATEDKDSFERLLDRALKDQDSRVRVSSIRSLGALKDARAAKPLLADDNMILNVEEREHGPNLPNEVNELLEIATTIGRVLPVSRNTDAVNFLRRLRYTLRLSSPEVEIAFARVAPQLYQIAATDSLRPRVFSDANIPREERPALAGANWIRWASIGQGFAELASVKSDDPLLDASIKEQSVNLLSGFLKCPVYRAERRPLRIRPGVVVAARCTPLEPRAVPDFLRALAAFKPPSLADALRVRLKDSDVIVRATAAELLGELPADETNTRALIEALPVALKDKELNDAALAILDSLAKLKSAKANEVIKTALESNDYLVRRRAVALLKANGAGDFSSRIGIVQTRNTAADYERAVGRIGKQVEAIVTTDKGKFTIRLLPDDATLNVDNFIQLAKRKYFNGITVHRVVPNFVIQDGDPRGDGNGGPGYQIRCEINEVPYERGAVGMALSGKDTGGSQWFITHSPQPHLDGGYTVFGNVVSGMDKVDDIVRGDVVRSIVITESVRRSSNGVANNR